MKALALITSLLAAQVVYTTMDLAPEISSDVTTVVNDAIQWQENTVATYEELFPGKNSQAARAQWDINKEAAQTRLKNFNQALTNETNDN